MEGGSRLGGKAVNRFPGVRSAHLAEVEAAISTVPGILISKDVTPASLIVASVVFFTITKKAHLTCTLAQRHLKAAGHHVFVERSR